MLTTIVALDIETTGLDPSRDAIIEIGAVKFKGPREVETFSTLINPRPNRLPAFVTKLTGITEAMLTHAPSLPQALPRLQAFVGDLPILGHNVRFDLAFLHKREAFTTNDVIDTFDLAAVLLPTAGRYNLGALGKQLGVGLPATHRALDDCRATVGLYRALYRLAEALPIDVLAELVHLGQEIDWGGGLAFEEVLRARARERVGPRTAGGPAPAPLGGRAERALQRRSPPTRLDLDQLSALLDAAGPFAQAFPGYEHRTEQIQMLRAVGRAFSEGRHLMVEAGTGTGKSVSYLLPAALWAMQNGERVVVSTNTLNLQDQLIGKDVPALQAALGLAFRAVVLKGRSHYVCPRRLDAMRRHGPASADEMRVLAKVLVWLHQTRALDAAPGLPPPELSLNPAERAVWARLSAEDEACTADRCQGAQGGRCPFYRAHQAAQGAHVVIVNHALLLADIASGNRVIPEYDHLIIDEAHHLEAAATEGLSWDVNRPELERRLREVGGPRAGLLGRVVTATRGGLAPAEAGWFEREAIRAHDQATTALALGRHFFDAVAQFLEEQRDAVGGSEYTVQIRVTQAARKQPYFEQVQMSWEELRGALASLTESLSRMARALADVDEAAIESALDLASAAGTAARYVGALVTNLDGLVMKPEPGMIYWAEAQANGDRLALHAAPLHVGSLVEKHLWHAKQTVVLTSATLTTAGDFDYLRDRLNADEADELALGSPFDYARSTLLYVATDVPEPNVRPQHQKVVEKTIIDLCLATRGRALVLFTSYAQLRQTANAIRGPLEQAGLAVFDQSDGSSRTFLLDSFRTTGGGVLLGTKSFWEGVDVPGEALSVLVIVKLPFDVPSDPIVAARSETYDQAFSQYALPEAVLRFRQGFGRLIRTRSDRGVVAVLDGRIVRKEYGRAFLDSIPACTRRQGPAANLPHEAARWLATKLPEQTD